MKRMTLFITGILACGFLHAQEAPPEEGTTETQIAPTEIVRNFIDAYNAHDIQRMNDFVTDDIIWMSVDKNKLNTETTGKDQLSESMKSYFEGLPSTRSKLHSVRALGNFVTSIEESQWESKGAQKSRCAISVYELADGLIANVWYFAAHTCEEDAPE